MEIKELKNYLKNLPDLLDKDDAVKRRKKALKSFEYFVKTYFAHHIGGENIKETSEFRRFIYKNLERLALENRHLVFESYRGSAKTTLITRLFTLYSLIKRKKYAVIISSTLDIAKESLETIKTEIEENAKLKNDFALEVGYLWTSDEIIFRASRAIKKIKVFGAGKKIRGTNFLGNRPDLIVLDDVENDENIQSKAQRDKLFNWFFKAILKLNFIGSKDYNYIIVGTRLHHDGLLARLADIYSSFKFKLIKEFPPFFDEITKENYRNFNYCDMKIDDEKMDKKEIVKIFLENKESFYSEYQNEPLSRDGAIFTGYKTFDEEPIFEQVYIGIDPALGKSKGDYFAITILGRLQNKFYAKSFGYKIRPDAMLEKIINFYIKYINFTPIIAIETVQFQEFFKDTLKKEALQRGLFLRIRELKNSIAKEIRIDGLAPYIADGTILINSGSHLLAEELDTYPKSAHDDLLDSLEMAFRVANTSRVDYGALNKLMTKKRKFFDFFKRKI